jgi:hypothetical protein
VSATITSRDVAQRSTHRNKSLNTSGAEVKRPESVKELDELGRVRLSKHFCMREMLYSEVANFHGIPNIPEDPDLAIAAGSKLCELVLEPICQAFGPIIVRSAYRSPTVNDFCAKRLATHGTSYYCFPNEYNRARHIWDLRDADGYMGATVTIVVPRYLDEWEQTRDYKPLAWWLLDHVPDFSAVMFFPWQCAFNIGWHEGPSKRPIWEDLVTTAEKLDNVVLLTEQGMPNFDGDHSHLYPNLAGIAPARS